MERLAPYEWMIEHRPGVKHQNADSLSRMPCSGTCSQCMKIQNQSDVDNVIEEVLINCRVITVEESVKRRSRRYRRRGEDLRLVNSLGQRWDQEELIAATAADPVLSVLLGW